MLQLNLEALAGTDAIPSNPGWDDDLHDIPTNYLHNRAGDFLVGLSTGTLVAMGGVLVGGSSTAEVKRIRVLPVFQGRGYARILLSTLEARAAGLGAEAIFADTTVQQVKAQGLYRSMGYELVESFETDGFTILRYRKNLG